MPHDAEIITSLQNPRIKQLVKLRDRRPRDAAGVFMVEGYRQIRRALDKGFKPTEFYYSPEWFLGEKENEPGLIAEAAANGARLFELSKDAFAKVAYRERPDGLIVCDPVTDLFNPNVVRASTGVLFSVPVVIAESAAVRVWLQAKGIRSVATTPAATESYTDSDLTGPMAIVMGSEQYGLSEDWLREADDRVRIPMAGQADSLNVAMATIITLFEAMRQRT